MERKGKRNRKRIREVLSNCWRKNGMRRKDGPWSMVRKVPVRWSMWLPIAGGGLQPPRLWLPLRQLLNSNGLLCPNIIPAPPFNDYCTTIARLKLIKETNSTAVVVTITVSREEECPHFALQLIAGIVNCASVTTTFTSTCTSTWTVNTHYTDSWPFSWSFDCLVTHVLTYFQPSPSFQVSAWPQIHLVSDFLLHLLSFFSPFFFLLFPFLTLFLFLFLSLLLLGSAMKEERADEPHAVVSITTRTSDWWCEEI